MSDDAEQGGEAPCFAHLLDEPLVLGDSELADLLRDLADAIVIADADGTIVFWNQAAERIFGWSSNEAMGRSLDLIIPERQRDRHWSGYRKTMGTGDTKYGEQLLEVPALHRDGRRLSIAFTVTLLRRDGEHRPYAIAAVIRDQTQRWQESRRLNEELAALRTASTASWRRRRSRRRSSGSPAAPASGDVEEIRISEEHPPRALPSFMPATGSTR